MHKKEKEKKGQNRFTPGGKTTPILPIFIIITDLLGVLFMRKYLVLYKIVGKIIE